MDFKVGDIIVTKSNVYWQGDNIGDRLGKVIDTTGYILVEIYDFDANPVKCFRYELEVLGELKSTSDITDQEIQDFFDDIDIP